MRWLSDDDVRRLLTPERAREGVQQALLALVAGEAQQPQRVAVDAAGLGATLFMPAELKKPATLGLKVLSLRKGNSERGLPAIVGAVLLQDAETGQPRLGMDAAVLTGRRTAALSAVATERLARADARSLGVFGAGFQALYHIEAILAVRPGLEVRITNRTPERAQALAEKVRSELGAPARVVDSETAAAADIIVTATAAREAVLKTVRDGTHVNLIGAYQPETREAAADVLRGAKVYADYLPACKVEAGDLIQAVNEGALAWHDVHELGDLLRGQAPGRIDAQEITVMKSVGCSAFDLACADAIAAVAS